MWILKANRCSWLEGKWFPSWVISPQLNLIILITIHSLLYSFIFTFISNFHYCSLLSILVKVLLFSMTLLSNLFNSLIFFNSWLRNIYSYSLSVLWTDFIFIIFYYLPWYPLFFFFCCVFYGFIGFLKFLYSEECNLLLDHFDSGFMLWMCKGYSQRLQELSQDPELT